MSCDIGGHLKRCGHGLKTGKQNDEGIGLSKNGQNGRFSRTRRRPERVWRHLILKPLPKNRPKGLPSISIAVLGPLMDGLQELGFQTGLI